MTGRKTPFQRTLRSGKKLFGLEDTKLQPIPELDPTPQPIPGREEDEAKKRAARRTGRGRQTNILAGRMMAQRGGNILNTKLG